MNKCLLYLLLLFVCVSVCVCVCEGEQERFYHFYVLVVLLVLGMDIKSDGVIANYNNDVYAYTPPHTPSNKYTHVYTQLLT